MNSTTTLLVKPIEKKLKDRFKAACALNGQTMSAVLVQFMTEYVRSTLGAKGTSH